MTKANFLFEPDAPEEKISALWICYLESIFKRKTHQMMTEVKRRRRKLKPLEEAKQFAVLKKDKHGLEAKFISDFKGRGVFSCTEFDKGDFLLEYRGDLISKEECERRQSIYHDALKVFLFEFRYNGKLLCVDAARDDGSLGRFVNDDHINPNSRMKTICVDGKPHLCLFATRNISPDDEITYDYGDSEWPWRRTVTPNTQMSSDNNGCGAVTVGVDETLCEVESATLEMNTLSKSEVQDKEKVTPEKDQLPFNDQDSSEKDVVKISPVKVPVLNEKQSFCAPTEAVEEVCKHKVVTSAISSMDKCSVCVGPVAAMKWFGLRCKC
ncbi:hypothetical protein QQF64_018593 [Cirrhinus molitorella]|uniref:SET domain-containing protein n=1 Tax=Cirrhinus molitorella TaxID=172907 RepID=A0ABR3LGL7_9TELE